MTLSTLRDKLSTLAPSDLVDFIVDLQGHDDVVDRRIASLVAHLDPSNESRRLLAWIDDLLRRGFVDWRESSAFADEIDDLVDAIEALAARRPREARQVADRLIEAAPRLIEEADDSDGDIGLALDRTYVAWLRAAAGERAQEPDAIDWVERVRELHAKDRYSFTDDLLPEAGILLREDELRGLATTYEADADSKLRHRRALGQVALALGDASLFARSASMGSPDLDDFRKADIVETCLRLDAPDEALPWLEEPWRNEVYRLEMRAKVFAARGDRGQELEALRSAWRHRCAWETLEPLLDRVGPDERESLTAEAIERAPETEIRPGLEILLRLDRVDDAAALATERRDELGPIFYGALADMAEAFERHGHALAATLAYRTLLDDILRRGYSRAYHHAARYYEALGRLSPSVDDWRDVPSHADYVDDLRDQHGLKRSFWSRVGSLTCKPTDKRQNTSPEEKGID